jgi:hypothetical protein
MHDALDCTGIHEAGDFAEVLPQQRPSLRQRWASPWVVWRLERRRLVERRQELLERPGSVCRISRRRRQRALSIEPPGNRPPPGETAACSAEVDRRRDGQRQPVRQSWKPSVLVRHQDGRCRTPRQTHHEGVAEPEESIVPPFTQWPERQPRQLGTLLLQQAAYERMPIENQLWV